MGYLPVTTSVVGRGSELRALTASLDDARAGRGSVFLVAGVPGIGKSRLAFEVRGLAAHNGMAVLWGRCFEGESARAFAPWVEALSGYLQGLDRDLEKIQHQLGQHAATLARLLPNVRDRLPDLPPAPSTTSGEERVRLFDAVAHLLLAAAHDRPVLLVLDDLHCVGEVSSQVAQQGERCPVGPHPSSSWARCARRNSPPSSRSTSCSRCCATRHPASISL